MKRILITIVLVALCAASYSQITIASARAMSIGSVVNVKGIVLNGSELGTIRYIYDGTDAIGLYSTTLSGVHRGDTVNVTGTTTNYNTLLEMNPVSAFTVVNSGNTMSAPQVITPNQLAEANESQLMQINNVMFANGGNPFAGNTTYNFTSNSQNGSVFIRTGSPLIGRIIPNISCTLIGINSEFASQYQMLPRDSNDIIVTSTIYMTTLPVQTNIATTGFDVNWNTNIAGSTFIEYGHTPNLELGILNGVGGNTSHNVSITGSTQATIFYVQAFSVSGNDTASSTIEVYCTQSASTGSIKVYFDKSVDTTVSSGTNAIQLLNTIPDTLAAYMGRAHISMDIAIYDFGNSAIANAINTAFANGIKIRVIYDGSTSNLSIPTLNSSIPKVASPTGGPYNIMHNKFVIIDAESSNPNDPIVWTGATNWTSEQVTTDDNNVIIFQDQSMARGYKLEFNEMWGDTGMVYNSVNSKFGPYKANNTPHEYVVGGKRVESYFSPSDGTTAHLITALNTANSDICFALNDITRTDLSYAITDNVTNNGINAYGVVDTSTTTSNFAYTNLQTVLGPRVRVYHEGGLEHNKYAIIDNMDTASDPQLITGSHNWSTAAETQNDENTVIVHDATIANLFYQEFYKRYTTAGGSLNSGITKINNGINSFKVCPNPNTGDFTINCNLINNEKVVVELVDFTGRVVMNKTLDGISGANTFEVNVQTLSQGMYFLKLSVGNDFVTSKIVVQ